MINITSLNKLWILYIIVNKTSTIILETEYLFKYLVKYLFNFIELQSVLYCKQEIVFSHSQINETFTILKIDTVKQFLSRVKCGKVAHLKFISELYFI